MKLLKAAMFILFILIINYAGTPADKIKTSSVGENTMFPLEITLKENESYNVNNEFSIKVIEIVEKRLYPDRRPMMRITLEFVIKKEKKQIFLTSDDPVICLDNYKITYLGGWRSEAQLKIEQVKNN